MQTSSSNILDKKYSKLILQISPQEVSFCIVNTLNNNIETFGNYELKNAHSFAEAENKAINFIKKTQILQNDFDTILVLHNNHLNTFVPQVLFEENSLGNYLQYNVKVFENDFITYDEISNYEMNNVYIPDVTINNALIDIYGNFNYKHASTILLKKVLDLCKNIDEPQVYVHFQDHNFQLIAVKNQKLLLYNTFEYETKEDFIYYLLFTAEQLQLNPETFLLRLLGKISKESDLFQIAYKYVRNVSLFFDHNDLDKNISQENYLQHFILIHACE